MVLRMLNVLQCLVIFKECKISLLNNIFMFLLHALDGAIKLNFYSMPFILAEV